MKWGLCVVCYKKPTIRQAARQKLGLYKGESTLEEKKPKPKKPKEEKPKKERPITWHEPTMEELDRMIAERYPTMPGWEPHDE